MFNFRDGSGWTFELELECFVIFKRIEDADFPRGLQTDLCRELERRSPLGLETIKAKVGNFKSEAGVTSPSHSSQATKYIYCEFGELSVAEAESLLRGYKLCNETAASVRGNDTADAQYNSAFSRALTLANEAGRVCLMPPVWARFHALLLDGNQRGADPTLRDPLILGYWHESSDESKRQRLNEHIIWASQNGRIECACEFLEALSERDWYRG